VGAVPGGLRGRMKHSADQCSEGCGALRLIWGIGKSNGMFLCPRARARPHWADLLGSFGGVLAWPIACWAAATPPPDLKTASASGKPSRSTGPRRARPAPGAAPPRQPGVPGRDHAAC